MNTVVVAQTIQLILAPVVMISSAAVILNGLLAHYGEVNARIRAMDRERFDLLHLEVKSSDQGLVAERVAQIDHQIPDLLERHRLIHNAMLAVYYSIMVLVCSMFVVAAAELTDVAWLPAVVLALLLGGTAILLFGLVLTTAEIRRSRLSIVYEAEGARRLRANLAHTPASHGQTPHA